MIIRRTFTYIPFSNLHLFAELAEGTLLADAVSIMGSLDLVIPEIDR